MSRRAPFPRIHPLFFVTRPLPGSRVLIRWERPRPRATRNRAFARLTAAAGSIICSQAGSCTSNLATHSNVEGDFHALGKLSRPRALGVRRVGQRIAQRVAAHTNILKILLTMNVVSESRDTSVAGRQLT